MAALLKVLDIIQYKNGKTIEIFDWKREILVTVCPIYCNTIEAMLKLIANVHHVIKNDIPGDFVETGVFMGGSCMIIAEVLNNLK